MTKIIPFIIISLFVMFLTGCASLNTPVDSQTFSANKGIEPQGPDESGTTQVIYLGLDRRGYLPREISVDAGKPVTLRNDGTLGGCGLYPVQAELGMQADFSKTQEYTFIPQKKGTFTYSCSMGMFKGIISVV